MENRLKNNNVLYGWINRRWTPQVSHVGFKDQTTFLPYEHMANSLAFLLNVDPTDKDDYQHWVKRWKTMYAEVSKAIRELRKLRSPAAFEAYNANRKYPVLHPHTDLDRLRCYANMMLTQRANMRKLNGLHMERRNHE
jgi:hypothetical protein